MRYAPAVSATVGNWFRHYREQYRWPEASSRQKSEKTVNEIESEVKSALLAHKPESLKSALIRVHYWKSNRTGSRYEKTLKKYNPEYFERLLGMSVYSGIDKLEQVIRHLKIKNCNLPVCTAIASFLYGRRDVPIIDNYVAQFFARRFNINRYDEEMKEILSWIAEINFKLETFSATHRKLRLAVYSDSGFNHNLSLYINEFVPECDHIAKALSASGYSYSGIDDKSREFTPIDVEMAIFSWAMKNKNLADVVPTEYRNIVRKEGILSWEPIVRGTRTPVRAIVENSRLGYSPEEITDSLPHLSLEAVFDALRYYSYHRQEINEYIERNRVPPELIHSSVRNL